MYGKQILKKSKDVTNEHFVNKIYTGDKLNAYGIKLWKDIGIDTSSMTISNLSSFFKPGITEDVIKMSFMRYEERRKLKITMLEEFDAEKKQI